jgi:photosystem II stability/assembly factor-like uncharacterized protein
MHAAFGTPDISGQPDRCRSSHQPFAGWPILALALALLGGILAAAPAWEPQASGTKERLRGLSVVSDRVAWASGNKGTVLRTVDGGSTWIALKVPDSANLDFRDVEAFDDRTAYLLSIGPGDRSRICKTTDGGRTWREQFRNPNPKAFYDDIAFWNVNAGLAIGDPVDGRFTVIRTTDGGKTWLPPPAEGMPSALPGDGAFAASGSILAVQGTRNAWLATGGAARARVFRSTDRGLTWTVADTPMIAGTSSAGIFSIAFSDVGHGLIVGGDYRKEPESSDNLARTIDSGRTWTLIGATRLPGFRSGVAFVQGTRGRSLLAVGPAGTDWSADGGQTWTPLGDGGYDAVRVAPSGRVAWATGAGGRIGKLSRLR